LSTIGQAAPSERAGYIAAAEVPHVPVDFSNERPASEEHEDGSDPDDTQTATGIFLSEFANRLGNNGDSKAFNEAAESYQGASQPNEQESDGALIEGLHGLILAG
jgi:hypothetical protein